MGSVRRWLHPSRMSSHDAAAGVRRLSMAVNHKLATKTHEKKQSWECFGRHLFSFSSYCKFWSFGVLCKLGEYICIGRRTSWSNRFCFKTKANRLLIAMHQFGLGHNCLANERRNRYLVLNTQSTGVEYQFIYYQEDGVIKHTGANSCHIQTY